MVDVVSSYSSSSKPNIKGSERSLQTGTVPLFSFCSAAFTTRPPPQKSFVQVNPLSFLSLFSFLICYSFRVFAHSCALVGQGLIKFHSVFCFVVLGIKSVYCRLSYLLEREAEQEKNVRANRKGPSATGWPGSE